MFTKLYGNLLLVKSSNAGETRPTLKIHMPYQSKQARQLSDTYHEKSLGSTICKPTGRRKYSSDLLQGDQKFLVYCCLKERLKMFRN